ncbi:MAG TPA: hypothetical protein VGP11_02775, partial [Acidimicrobiales bacterium]|nr:hypothetical protein [Acidimicrobiales bacterium]
LVNVSMWLASSTGLAVFGTLAASRTSSLLKSGSSSANALVAGYHEAFFIGAILAAIALLVTVTVLRASARDAAPAPTGASIADEAEHGQFEIVSEF